MSQEQRDALVASGALFFQDGTQSTDLQNVDFTQTELIAALCFLVFERGWPIEITAVRSDHHDDSDLSAGPDFIGTHAHGWAVDCWPLNTRKAGDYIDATVGRFQRFLADVAESPFLYQIGLAGSSWTGTNQIAAGATVFQDDGADHVHIGVKP